MLGKPLRQLHKSKSHGVAPHTGILDLCLRWTHYCNTDWSQSALRGSRALWGGGITCLHIDVEDGVGGHQRGVREPDQVRVEGALRSQQGNDFLGL